MLRVDCRVSARNLCNRETSARASEGGAEHEPQMLLSEQLVGEARGRRPRPMTRREAAVSLASAAAYLTVATAIAAWLPSERTVDPLVIAALVGGYVVVSQVKFEFGGYYVVPEQLMFVPMLLILPLPLVPLLVGVAAAVAVAPDIMSARLHRDRWLASIPDCWFVVGPVLVLGAFAPGSGTLADVEIYLAAFAAQLVFDFSWMLTRDRLIDRAPLREVARGFVGTARVEAVLTPIAFLAAAEAIDHPVALVAIAPLLWLLVSFSRDRRERYSAALELQRAYRGTVMLLADVVQHEDPYTAHHSRSVVDLVNAVADELGVQEEARQELEFAAMLHDVGKIAIPQEILNKPAKLSDDEFEIVKTHTIEGQYMLDRVGGMLGRVGEVVRSCHERWDGGGYPDGLAGKAIALESRIVFVCDAYHAMTSDRVYRKAMSPEDALLELAVNAGTQFDPAVVGAISQVVEQGEPARLPVDEIKGMLAAGQPLARKASVSA